MTRKGRIAIHINQRNLQSSSSRREHGPCRACQTIPSPTPTVQVPGSLLDELRRFFSRPVPSAPSWPNLRCPTASNPRCGHQRTSRLKPSTSDLPNWNDRRPKGASHKQPLPAGNRPFRMLASCLRLVMGTPSRPKTRPPRGLPVPWTKRSKRWIGGRSRRNKENSQPILQQDESTRGRSLRWLWFSGKGSQDTGLPSSQWNWLLVWNIFGNWNARWNWMVRHVDWLVPCLNSSLLENWMIVGGQCRMWLVACVDELVVQGFYNSFLSLFWKTLHGVARALIVRPRTLWFLIWWKILGNLDSALTLPAYLSHSMVHRTPSDASSNLRNLTQGVLERWAINRNSATRQKPSSSVSSPPDISCVLCVSLQFILSFYRFLEPSAMTFFRGSGNYKTFLWEKITFHS